MKPPVIWGQGQIFTYSGLDGKTDFNDGLCGYLSGDRIGICFKIPFEADLYLSDVKFDEYTNFKYKAVTSDYIKAAVDNEEFSFVFLDAYTVIGKLSSKNKISCFVDDEDNRDKVCLTVKNGRFAFAVGKDKSEAQKRAEIAVNADIELEESKKLEYYGRFGYSGTHNELFAKCLSVMKSQIYSPQGNFKVRWSTPERYPHKHLWLWDSCFHAIGFRHIDTKLAEELILADFSCQREDGFISHVISADWSSDITQPPVIAYGALKVYEKSGNREFLEYIFEHNKAFLNWCENNRRKTKLNLYTWHRSEDINCRCDESGMDNSTRFDTKSELFAIDFSCFMANEMRLMAKIADILGKDGEIGFFNSKFEAIKKDINNVLWSEKDGFYFDYDIDNNRFHNISSVASFLPLFSGVCDREKAEKLVKTLTDENKYWTEFPIPSLTLESDYFGDDMWRGPTWINYNFMLSEGLRDFGFDGIADTVVEKTVKYVEKYYLQTGTLYEFYDSEDKRPPYALNRKGAVHNPYNPNIKVQSIRDYGWTTTLTFDLLNREK